MIQKLIVRIKAYREYKHLDYWFRQEGTKHAMSKKQFIRNRLKKAGFKIYLICDKNHDKSD